MRIGILSDTHDHLPNIAKAVEAFLSHGVEAVIHAGDFCSPFTVPVFKPLADKGLKMYAVFGNNDGDRYLLGRRGGEYVTFTDFSCSLTLDGKKVVVMHYPDLAEDLYRLGAYDLVVYGHNHRLRLDGGDKKILNPGTCAGYLAETATIALWETRGMGVEIVRV